MNKSSEEILTEEIKLLRAALQRKEAALAILEGSSGNFNSELQTDTPISLNALYEYPKKAPIKKKVLSLIKQRNMFVRKSELVTLYLNKEGKRDSDDKEAAINEITNALSNLRTAGKIKNYKPNEVKMKGVLWGLLEFFNNDGAPIVKFIPDLRDLSDDD